MKKLRWTFGMLAAFCVVLLAVLLFAVNRQIDRERAATHRAFAERAFDEMERSLTGILERDDARSRVGARATSERAAYGYFELYADLSGRSGRGVTNWWLRPRPARTPSFASAPLADAIAQSTIAREENWGYRAQEPGSTVSLSGEPAEDVPVYRALAAFNRSGRPRAFVDGAIGFDEYRVRASPDHVVVFRALSRLDVRRTPQTGHLEGIVVERRALRDWLADQVFGDASIEGFDIFLDDPSADDPLAFDPAAASEPYAFRHRFAYPFHELAAGLTVAPIKNASSTTTLHLLTGLLALAVLAGLFAAYRMTAARVRFAERQDQFVSAVTHELRTPLTTLRMYSEMLRDGIVPPDSRREYHDAMVSESERLGRLVDNVLQKAKLAKRAPAARPEAIDLAPAIEHAIAIVAPHAQAKGFEVVSSIQAGVPSVLAERDAITQVVVNLVDNAIAHSGESTEKRVVAVRCERRAGRVVLSVRDHGHGVPHELLHDIFEPFVSAAPGARGVGLGLALVRSLVTQMGGTVFAENADGGGLRVSALLRAA